MTKAGSPGRETPPMTAVPRRASLTALLLAAAFVAAELDEPHVCATLTEHASVIVHDNDFEVVLDPDGDNHLYAELELNAHNTAWDLLLTKPYKDGGKAVNAWEITGLKTAV